MSHYPTSEEAERHSSSTRHTLTEAYRADASSSSVSLRIYLLGSFTLESADGTPLSLDSLPGRSHSSALLKVLLCHPERRVRRDQVVEALWPGQSSHVMEGALGVAKSTLKTHLEAICGQSLMPRVKGDPPMYSLVGQSVLWTDIDAIERLIRQAVNTPETQEARALWEAAYALLQRGELLADDLNTYWYPSRLVQERKKKLAKQRTQCVLRIADLCCEAGYLERAVHVLTAESEAYPAQEELVLHLMNLLASQGRSAEALQSYTRLETVLLESGAEPREETKELAHRLRSAGATKQKTDSSPLSRMAQMQGQETPQAYTTDLRNTATQLSPLQQTLGLAQAHHRLIDWGEAPYPEQFYGRDEELARLKTWIVEDRCRLVSILGMGGMGKTSLAVILAHQIQGDFEYVFWRSLQNAPPLKAVLQDCIKFVSGQQQVSVPEDQEGQISLLLEYLREHHCLIVLDNGESLLQAGSRTGQYREGYEEYGRLFQRIGGGRHQSCLLLTSREKPREIALLEGNTSPVRSYQLDGLSVADGQKILEDKGLIGTEKGEAFLIDHYAGNPLALKLVSQFIFEVFNGDIDGFLKDGEKNFSDIRDVLHQQFERLSTFEQEIMYWLAIEREKISLIGLQEDFLQPGSKTDLQEALRSLRRRCLIETSATGFTLQNVLMEYVTNRFMEAICEEVSTGKLVLFDRYALVKAQANEYVRESQVRLFVQPLIRHLLEAFGTKRYEEHLKQLLSLLHPVPELPSGYAAGNLLNILLQSKCDLRGCDLSRLTIRQAYLQGASLPDTTFAFARLVNCTFTETFGSILTVAFSPDGNMLAAGTSNGEVRLWNTITGQLLQQFEGQSNWVRSIVFSPDGRLLAGGGDDQTICIWDVQTGTCLQTLRGHQAWVRSLVFSPSENILISGSDDQTIRIWEYQTGHCLRILQGHTDKIKSIALSPDGNLLASGSLDHTIRIWDLVTGQCFKILTNETSSIWSITFSPDGSLIASGCDDHLVYLWDIATNRCISTFQGHTKRIWSVAFTSDGKVLASGGEDGTIRLWECATGRCQHIVQGHTSVVWSIAFHPQGEILASGGDDQCIRLWNRQSGTCLRTLEGYAFWVNAVATASTNHLLASGEDHRQIHVWNLETGQCLHTLVYPSRVRAVSFNLDGHLLAGAGDTQMISLWEMPTGHLFGTLQGHTDWINALAFTPDGSLLASGGEDRTIRLWNPQAGLRAVAVMEGHTSRIRALAFSPDGQLLASGGDDYELRIWERTTQHCIGTWQGIGTPIWSLIFSPDGNILASGMSDGTIRLWDIKTGNCASAFHIKAGIICSLVFSPDGQELMASADDGSIWQWNISSGQGYPLRSPQKIIARSLAFAPTQHILVAGNNDGTIELRDITMSQCRTIRAERPYERMNIFGIRGVTNVQKAALIALGAIEEDPSSSTS